MKWIVLLIVLVLSGCTPSPSIDFSDFEKMVGQWKSVDARPNGSSGRGDTFFVEKWTQETTRLIGTGYVLQKKDTAFSEKLIVERVNDKLVYIADIKGQNPVMYTCTAQTSESWIFENTEHDFPSKISYNLISQQKLTVILEGTKNGKSVTEKLNFEKVANE
jgi:hypothetical protein